MFFNIKKLREIALEKTTNLVNNQDFLYIDKGGKVLAVAHADTVFKDSELFFLYEPRKNIVFSPGLDDRLGVYILLEVLKNVDIDILITTGEESMNSSAKLFFPPKTYHWMVEFDREDDDIATYQYQWDEKFLRKYFPAVNYGSYSDIVDLEHLGCLGLNIGIGYYYKHRINCYALLSETERAIKRFLKFFEENKNRRFKHKPSPPPPLKKVSKNNYKYSKYWLSPSFYEESGGKNFCPFCGAEITEEEELIYEQYRMCASCAFG
jgi:hypothetical protein